ncbi:hypothetical protein Gotur_023178 [Gossypium turneri]
MGGYLAMKENIVVCTSSSNHGDNYYTLSGGLDPWVIEVKSCNSGGRFITQVELGGGTQIKLLKEQAKEKKLNRNISATKEKMEIQKDVNGKIIYDDGKKEIM